MLKNDPFKLCILVILLVFTANGNSPVIHYNPSIDNNGTIIFSNKSLNNSDFKGEPSYIIEVHASCNRVNADDLFSMGIYISGVGDVELAKLRVFIPNYLVKEKDAIGHKYIKLDQVFFYPSNPNLTEKVTYLDQEPQFSKTVRSEFFIPRDIRGLHNYGETTAHFKENLLDDHPPFNLSFHISQDAPAGDHAININLFYKSNGKWYSDIKTVPLHVNYWYENEIWQYAIIIALITSIISAISDLPNVIRILKKKVYSKYIKRILYFFI